MKLKCLLNPVGGFLTPTAVEERDPLLTETKNFNEKKY